MNENQTLAIVVIAGGILLFVFKDAPTKIPEPAPEPMDQVYDANEPKHASPLQPNQSTIHSKTSRTR